MISVLSYIKVNDYKFSNSILIYALLKVYCIGIPRLRFFDLVDELKKKNGGYFVQDLVSYHKNEGFIES